MKKLFDVSYVSKKSQARIAIITTDHGVIQTPAFVPVGTKGTIKGLTQEQTADLHIQLSFVNTYHLVTHPGVEILAKAGGIHRFAQYNIPLMSDSGGFQVFSLAQNTKRQTSHIVIPAQAGIQTKMSNKNDNFRLDPGSGAGMTNSNQRKANVRGEEEPLVLKISEDGVKFRSVYDGQTIEFTPESSMEFQRIIGADLLMAFDECTYYPATHEYAEKAMKRTHEWLKRCIQSVESQKSIKSKVKNNSSDLMNFKDFTDFKTQHLYGIIQGGTYEDLRVASAKFIAGQDVSGVAIGGVSVGETKEEMRNQVKWVAPYLPKDKPVHLLGVGQIDDIIDLVGHGIDTFDCVEPTRLARMGRIYQLKNILRFVETHCNASLREQQEFDFDINKTLYKADLSRIDEGCECMVCKKYTKAYLHHLFKQRELLGYTLATYHNLYVMERLMGEIRSLILQGCI